MPVFKGESFKDRQSAVVEARKALLEKFKSRPAADDPVVIAKEAERRAIVEARDKRTQEREALRKQQAAEEAVRKAAEEAARLASEAMAEGERVEKERVDAELAIMTKQEEAQRKIDEEVAKKAERDARYAARKARKIERKGQLERMW